MRPRFLTGDMVQASPSGFHYGPYVRGMVISVQQSNNVPDARERGLQDLQPWSYWVMTSEWENVGPHIVGPLASDNIRPFPGPIPKHRPPQ
jgi:hypothetical protein